MKHKTRTKALSWLLSLAMALSLVPGMSLTAKAAGEKAYAAYDVTTETNKTKSGNDLTALQVTFNERQWYIIEDNSSSATSGTVTLLSADTSFGTKTFDDVNKSNKYSTSQVKAYLDSMTGTNGAFADVADAIETVNLTTNQYNSTAEYETVNGVKLYLLSTEEANSLPTNVRKAGFTGGDCGSNKEWWLRSPGYVSDNAVIVYGTSGNDLAIGYYVKKAFGVRPALKLDLSKVTFDSASKTFSVSAAAQEASADIRAKIVYLFTQFDSEYLKALIEGSSVDEYPARDAVSAKFNGEDADITYSQTSDNSADITISHGGNEIRFSVSIETDAESGDRITVVGQVTYTGDEPTDFSLTYQAPGAVTGVTLNKTETQTVAVDGSVALTATVAPEDAADKTVVWSVGGTDSDAVKLYSDEACTTEVGTDATETLTVYAKGISAGSATVTATSNADSTKSASCDVTVNEAQPSTYTLTIPSTLSVANSGWNATTGISATGTLASGKKLTVTASSGDEFALVNQSDSTQKVGYKLATASTDTEATTSWEFTELSSTATKKDMGIIVEDYSSKPAGTYQDTVTFTAKVEDAGNIVTLSTLTADYEAQSGDILTGTLDGATQHYKISIADGATVTLKDVNITNLEIGCDWAGINCPGDATLILEGTNTVCAGRDNNNENNYPGIWIAPNKTLTIDGDGRLTAYSDATTPYGAGIGGGYKINCGNIVINGGTITATGGGLAAGIGSAQESTCGDITINGGTITATGADGAAGIGSGGTISGAPTSSCGNITIANTVTKVTATGGFATNSIGAGQNSACGTVTIGGTVGEITTSPYTYQP